MPPKSPGTSYTGKPVRKLKLPKIGPAKTKNLFEEYFHVLLAVVFFAAAMLGKAGGFSTYNAVVVGAWIMAILWSGHQLKEYFAEKSKAEKGKTPAPQRQAGNEPPKVPLPLSPNMKPMIGPQWPVRAGARPSWPKLPKELATPTQPQAIPTSVSASTQTSQTNSNEKKRGFVYERPTLPERKAKLPNNWADPANKKANDKTFNNKKPKR